MVNISNLLSACIDASIRSEMIIKEVWDSRKFKTKNKGRGYNPFTSADIRAQQLIVAMIRKLWPTIKIVGEETCSDIKTDVEPSLDYYLDCPEMYKDINVKDLCVFIDPLDGTKEFLNGNLQAVLILIGISYKGQAIAGVMNRTYGDIYCGIVGTGGFIFHENIFIEIQTKIYEDRKIITTTKSRRGGLLNSVVKQLKPTDVIRVSAAGHKAALVLDQIADVYFFPVKGTKVWDTCAPNAIFNSLGWFFTDKNGEQINYSYKSRKKNMDGFVATFNKELHKECLELIKNY